MLAACQPPHDEINGPKTFVIKGDRAMGRNGEPVALGPINHVTEPLAPAPVTRPSHVQRGSPCIVQPENEPLTVVTLPALGTMIAMFIFSKLLVQSSYFSSDG